MLIISILSKIKEQKRLLCTFLSLSAAIFIILLSVSYADMYKYIDKDGTVRFSNTPQEGSELVEKYDAYQGIKDKLYGKKYWILENKYILVSESPHFPSKLKKIYGSNSFVVKDLIPDNENDRQYYKIEFASGQTAYIHSTDLVLSEGSSISTDNPNETVDKVLRATNISIGQYVWLKYPISSLSGFSKLMVKNYYSETISSSYFILIVEANKQEAKITIPYYSVDKLIAQVRDLFYISEASIPKWNEKVLKAIREKKVLMNMSNEQVEASWGKPKDINRSVGTWGSHEQWVYGDFGPYLYFENNKLTSWQD